MINLLPHEEQRQIRAARTNTLLVRYNFFLLGAVAFLGLAEGITYFYLSTSLATAEQTTAQNKAKVSNFAPVEAQASLFRTNLATAKQILDKEVVYTKVVLAIAKVLPSGVVLDTLNLDVQTFGTPITLVAHAKNYDSALMLKDSFQSSSLFSDVHFESIAAGETSGNANYPVTVNLSVTIKKDVAK
jgi:Tfp pilus assembly protein PilN